MQFVMMFDATPKRTVRKAVDAKVVEHECLLCTEPMNKRGLCDQHYGEYRVALLKVPHDKRTEFDARLIQEGHLLPSRQGQRLGSPVSPFAQAAQELTS